jgi:DNA (cytosine-5)-methyltransferase 1
MGYHRAGFKVVGVDIKPQPHYPFEFYQADAMTYPLEGFDAVHASPPCQRYSVLAAMHPDREYPDLVDSCREMLRRSGKPYVIENVERAPLAWASDLFGAHGLMLCGSMFGLKIDRGQLRRHRRFETSFYVSQPRCRHRLPTVGVYGHGGHTGKHRMLYRKEAALAMGIDWMNRDEMCQAIPPAYTEFIGRTLIEYLRREKDV